MNAGLVLLYKIGGLNVTWYFTDERADRQCNENAFQFRLIIMIIESEWMFYHVNNWIVGIMFRNVMECTVT